MKDDIRPEPARAPEPTDDSGARVTRRAAITGMVAAAVTPAALAAGWGTRPGLGRPTGPIGASTPEEALPLTEGTARYQHTATPLPDGRILLVGGYHRDTVAGTLAMPLASVEIYDPSRDRWFAVAPLQTPRARHAALLLPDGRVAVLGGYALDPLDTVELYDPYRDAWQYATPLSQPRFDHGASLAGQQIVLTGGVSLAPLPGVEIYTL
jgi:hypothetical protein